MSSEISNAELLAKIKAKINKEINKDRGVYDNTSGEIEGLRRANAIITEVVRSIINY